MRVSRVRIDMTRVGRKNGIQIIKTHGSYMYETP